MGAGNHGGFGNTYGSVAAGDAVYKSEPGDFFPNIANRKDKDKNGVYDVVAHGGATIIQVTHNGKTLEIDSRTAAKLIKSRTDYKHGQPIRLLSCDTGSSTSGFAQNLANKLNVVVEAPTKLVWAYPNGTTRTEILRSTATSTEREQNTTLPTTATATDLKTPILTQFLQLTPDLQAV